VAKTQVAFVAKQGNACRGSCVKSQLITCAVCWCFIFKLSHGLHLRYYESSASMKAMPCLFFECQCL